MGRSRKMRNSVLLQGTSEILMIRPDHILLSSALLSLVQRKDVLPYLHSDHCMLSVLFGTRSQGLKSDTPVSSGVHQMNVTSVCTCECKG